VPLFFIVNDPLPERDVGFNKIAASGSHLMVKAIELPADGNDCDAAGEMVHARAEGIIKFFVRDKRFPQKPCRVARGIISLLRKEYPEGVAVGMRLYTAPAGAEYEPDCTFEQFEAPQISPEGPSMAHEDWMLPPVWEFTEETLIVPFDGGPITACSTAFRRNSNSFGELLVPPTPLQRGVLPT
jgi:hypothetical protein